MENVLKNARGAMSLNEIQSAHVAARKKQISRFKASRVGFRREKNFDCQAREDYKGKRLGL